MPRRGQPVAYKLAKKERALIERASELEEITMSELSRRATLALARRIIREAEGGAEAGSRLDRMVRSAAAHSPPASNAGPWIRAPWDATTVAGLNAWQASGHVHPFTCGTDGCRTTLRATEAGWECPAGCGYTQDWAHDFMAAGPTAHIFGGMSGRTTRNPPTP